jgi:rubredoxin
MQNGRRGDVAQKTAPAIGKADADRCPAARFKFINTCGMRKCRHCKTTGRANAAR